MTTSWLMNSGIRSFRCFSGSSKPRIPATVAWLVLREECPALRHWMIPRRHTHSETAGLIVRKIAVHSWYLPVPVPFLCQVFVYFLFHHWDVTETFFYGLYKRVLVKECAENMFRSNKFMAITERQALSKRQRFVYIYRFSM